MSKTKKPRLGRGLSSLMSMPVSVNPTPVIEPAESSSSASTTTASQSEKPRHAEAGHREVATTASGQSLSAKSPDNHHADAASADSTGAQSPATPPHNGLVYLAIELIRANPHQPRQAFDAEALERLAASIRQDGLMQPIVVRPCPRPRKLDNGKLEDRKGGAGSASAGGDSQAQYEIVAGERRWRAGQLAGLTQLPAIIRDLTNQQMAEWALIENLQREDLNPMERAEAFRGLIEQFGLSHEQVADRVGVERPTISNALRLLDLHGDIQQMVRQNQLSAGHAKALLGLADPASQLSMARRASAGGWSVRMVEAAVKRIAGGATEQIAGKRLAKSAHVADLEQQIAAQLKTKVHIKTARRKGAGTLSIDFYNLDQFDELLTKLGVRLD